MTNTKTTTEKRIKTLSDTMGKAIAKLMKTDPTAAKALSIACQMVVESIRIGKL